jgi:hypothetical protein
MKSPLEPLRLESGVRGPGPPQGMLQKDRAAARKGAKTDWNAAPPFPVASDPHVWSEAIAAAGCAGSIVDAALALAGHGVPVFPVSPVGQKRPLNRHGVYSATTDHRIGRRRLGPENALKPSTESLWERRARASRLCRP